MSLHSPSPPQPTELPGLRRWVVAFCLIRFDLEQGQVLESSFPPDSLSPSLELQVAFNSFPDSTSHHLPHNRSSIHDSIFFFRTPSPSPSSSSSSSSFLYGFVFNRQRHDHRLKRGGEQRSVVILSHLPFPSVFRPLLQILAPLCFDLGPRALPLVASHVAAWPPPSAGLPSSLPIGSATLRAALPPDDVPSSFPEADLFGSFRGVLLHLWHLWELVVIGEPILVIAPTPPQCCEAVAALVGLASPLPCSLDFRPYFTIHDPDFARLNSLPLEGEEFPPMVLGVTNLFFLKALRGVPHVVSVGCVVNHPSKTLQHPPRSSSVSSFSTPKFSPMGLLSAMKMRRDGPLCLMTEHREAVWSSYSATTKPDTSVLNRLVDAGVSLRVEESMSVVNNEILRRHFSELSTNFLAPFGPYLRAVAPLEGSSPYAEPPPLPAFKADEFLRGLAARGPGKFLAKRMRANWLDLYKRFLTGRNFMPWFQRRRAAVEQEQHRLWRQARANLDIHKFILTMSEVEIVDCFHAIEHHLLREIQVQNSGKGALDSSTVCQKLKAHLQAVYNVLPKDMQQLLFLNPQRASLLRGNLELTKVPGHPSVNDGSGSDRPVSVSPR